MALYIVWYHLYVYCIVFANKLGTYYIFWRILKLKRSCPITWVKLWAEYAFKSPYFIW